MFGYRSIYNSNITIYLIFNQYLNLYELYHIQLKILSSYWLFAEVYRFGTHHFVYVVATETNFSLFRFDSIIENLENPLEKIVKWSQNIEPELAWNFVNNMLFRIIRSAYKKIVTNIHFSFVYRSVFCCPSCPSTSQMRCFKTWRKKPVRKRCSSSTPCTCIGTRTSGNFRK